MTPYNRDKRPPNAERSKNADRVLLATQRKIYLRQSRRAMLEILLRDGVASMDDVRAVVEVPEGVNPKLCGAVPNALARAGIIEREGFVPTRRPEGHGRHLTHWRLRDAAKAERWLSSHQTLPTLTTADQLSPPSDEKKSPTALSGKNRAAGEISGSNPFKTKDSNHG